VAVTPKALASGQLPVAKGTLYTVPGATQAIVREIRLVPTGSNRTGNLYINTAGTSRRIDAKDFTLTVGEVRVLRCVITLEAADLIEGDASAATEVDYVISGVEVT
jgi:hypothetical protein